MTLFGIGFLAGAFTTIIFYFVASAGGRTAVGRMAMRSRDGGKRVPPSASLAVLTIFAVVAAAVWSTHEITASDDLRKSATTGNVVSGETQSETASLQVAGMDAEISRIEKYLASVGTAPALQKALSDQTTASGLPDVETMIAGLAKRLEAEPGDVEGWRTLGWSYANTGRPSKAVEAYERAVGIAPNRDDLMEALRAARTAAGTGGKAAQEQQTQVPPEEERSESGETNKRD